MNFEKLGNDLIKILFKNKRFDKGEWENFLSNYFTESEAGDLQKAVEADLDFFKSNDPASVNYTYDKILSVRRGMLSIVAHRVFQQILKRENYDEVMFDLEIIAKFVQSFTSVEIHPGARLGSNFAIDHGHGTVVGETTETGENVFLYHGVTLGATGRRSKNNRRHPRIGNNVFLGNGAQVLGPSILKDNVLLASEAMILDSVIGKNVRISPGVLVSKLEIPDGFHVYGFDESTRKHIVRNPENDKVENIKFQKIDITKYSP